MGRPKVVREKPFKGMWIPCSVLEDKRLNPMDKMLFGYILTYPLMRGCPETNEIIAGDLGCSAQHIQNSISRLVKGGQLMRMKRKRRRHLAVPVDPCNPRGSFDDLMTSTTTREAL